MCRMDGAAALQVPQHRNGESLEHALFVANREEIAQRLSGMFVCSIAGINYRHARILRRYLRSAFARVPNDQEVCVGRSHSHRIGEAFAFRRRACRRVCTGYHAAAQSRHGAFEGEAKELLETTKQRTDSPTGIIRMAHSPFREAAKPSGRRSR